MTTILRGSGGEREQDRKFFAGEGGSGKNPENFARERGAREQGLKFCAGAGGEREQGRKFCAGAGGAGGFPPPFCSRGSPREKNLKRNKSHNWAVSAPFLDY